MKLKKSITNTIKGIGTKISTGLKNPVRDGRIAIEDSEKRIVKFVESTALFSAEIKRLEKLEQKMIDDVEKWNNASKKAAQTNNIDDARICLINKATASSHLKQFTVERTKNEKVLEKLKTQLNKAKIKIAKAKSNYSRLVAKLEGAELRKDLAKSCSSLITEGNCFQDLDALNGDVETAETEAETWEGLAEEECTDLLEKYEVPDTNIEQELKVLIQENCSTN